MEICAENRKQLQEILIVRKKFYVSILIRLFSGRERQQLLIQRRVGNFRQKNNSAEDGSGIDGTNGYFRRNSGCFAEQEFSEFRSEPFRGRENNSEFRSVDQK
jgi:hypothetical protein